ncbi:glycine betaine ABC transporter substrate-binding protein [Paenibacillus sp. NPDC057934]|uniref:glycine betaine ABC transporter substrate-binding protein n=1 Tax=Paenibacillus sp. NPDC057934 TaxID=3346282 RepID=UPI0036D87D57
MQTSQRSFVQKLKKRTFKQVSILLLAILVLVIAGCSNAKSSKIVIATKGNTESNIMQQLLKLIVTENTSINVETVKLDNNILWEAIKKGDVDAYVEYTGTALMNILKQAPERDPEKVYNKVKTMLNEQENLTMLDPLGFDSTYAFAIRKEVADKYGITNLTQLAKHSNQLIFAAEPLIEKSNRPDGYRLVKEAYGFNFKQLMGISSPPLQLEALKNKEADVIITLATKGIFEVNNLVPLEDDKHIFIPYYAAPLVRNETLKAHPELKEVLNKLSNKVSLQAIREMNRQVDAEQKEPEDVAKAWLKQEGFLK